MQRDLLVAGIRRRVRPYFVGPLMSGTGLGCVKTCGRSVVISRFWVLAVLWSGFCGLVDWIGARGPGEPDVAVMGGDLVG
jgi:hypothetical protein